MNCISCGSPNIKYQFDDKEHIDAINYFCEKTECYLEFIEIYKALTEKNSLNYVSCIAPSLKFLLNFSNDKILKKYQGFQIFFEEIYEKHPEVFFSYDNILEFYIMHLNKSFLNQERFIIGPMTMSKILNKIIDIKTIIEKFATGSWENIDKIKILMIFKNFKGDLLSLILKKEPLDINNLQKNGNFNIESIKNNSCLDSICELLKTQNLLKSDLSNLEIGLNQTYNIKVAKGCLMCLLCENFIKANDILDINLITTNKNVEKELMDKIRELIISS